MLALIAAACAFTAVASLILWRMGVLSSPIEARVSSLSSPVASRRRVEAPFADRVAVPVLDGVVRAFVQILPHRLIERTSRQILSAGSPISVQAFFTVVLIFSVVFPGVALLFITRSDSLSLFLVVILVLGCGAGLVSPFVWLRRRSRNRRLAIWRSLPDTFDMVTVCVEAGLALDAALRQVSSKLSGPMAEEIALVLREVGMGRPRREALEDLAYRTDVPEVTTFVHAVAQAEQLGTSLGRVLRAQGVSLRTQRRQRAEETARRAPVKMIFPLVFFIMPTFFIITIGPIAVQAIKFIGD